MKMEEGYRKGTVLGLTVAEIFILLVFLMLLALMSVNRYWGDKLEPWREIIASTTPKMVKEAMRDPDGQLKQIEKLNEQIAELQREKNRLQRRIRILEDREGETGERLDQAKSDLQKREQELAEAKSGNEDLDNRLRIMGKGITPPCWYQRIEETNPVTKANWREKPYYLFDIVIRDDHMEVQDLPVPEGGAEDDGGAPYRDEAKQLSLETIPYGVPLTDLQFRNAMNHLYIMGKSSQVRTYSCIFYVRVWDETPLGAKERWKQAHDAVLEQLFGTHQVRGISWKDRDKEPVNVPVFSSR